MGLLQNIPDVFSFLLILTLSLASSRATQLEILNNCTYTVWAAANPGGGKLLNQGETWTLNNISGSGRIWGRTKCVFGPDGRGKCESGDCNGRLECQVDGRAPNTLAEYSIDQNNADVVYVSVVEGFNIPMEFSPAASSSLSSECIQENKCAADVNGACPMELRDPAGCNNPCTVFGNSQFCCTSGNICEPTSYSKFFKDLCPYAFTFPYDFGQRSICSTGTDYKVVFCPKIGSHSAIHKTGRQDYLNAHNLARAEVGVGRMTWDSQIAAFSQQYLNTHVSDCKMVHSGSEYGENLAWSRGELSGSDAVRLWVDEKADYDYNSNSCASGRVCGQYTQVVSRDSVRLGCAKVRCNSGGTLVSCNYAPRGNYIGQRPY